jgi:hypothetical protein
MAGHSRDANVSIGKGPVVKKTTNEQTQEQPRRRGLVAALLALLLLSAFQTHLAMQSYELSADQALRACESRTRAGSPERTACTGLAPFWVNSDASLGGLREHSSRFVERLPQLADGMADKAIAATGRFYAWVTGEPVSEKT